MKQREQREDCKNTNHRQLVVLVVTCLLGAYTDNHLKNMNQIYECHINKQINYVDKQRDNEEEIVDSLRGNKEEKEKRNNFMNLKFL